MRALKQWRWLLIPMVLALALPAAAAAKGHRAEPTPLFTQLKLHGSNGYRIEVISFGNFILLQASAGNVGAAYAVDGRVAGNRIRARFGNLGRLAVEFRPKAKRDSCEFKRPGEFRGTIRFRGERGYTEVDARRARGAVFSFPESPACLGRSPFARKSGFPGLPLRRETTRLYAISKQPDRLSTVDVTGFPAERRVHLEASVEERRGKMFIARGSGVLVGGTNAFVSSGPGVHPAFAIVRPPKPFSGGATFLETGEAASSWAGSLSAWLPGLGKTSFAGPSYASGLCRRRVEDPRCPRSPIVQRPLTGLLQESGSQSQAPGEARLSWSR